MAPIDNADLAEIQGRRARYANRLMDFADETYRIEGRRRFRVVPSTCRVR